MTIVSEELDSLALLDSGFSKKQLRQLGACYAHIEYQCLRGQFACGMGVIMQKQGDMAMGAKCASRLQEYIDSLEDVVDESPELRTALSGEISLEAERLRTAAAAAASCPGREQVSCVIGHLAHVDPGEAEG